MPFYPEIKLVIRPYRRLKRIIKDTKPDRIHIATEGPLGWAARKYCLKNKIKFTTSYHTQFPDYIAKRFAWLIPPLYKAVHKQAVKLVRHFHTPSSSVMVSTKSLESQLLEWGFKAPISPLTRGIDNNFFHIGDKNRMQDIPTPVALYVGRVSIEKNLEDFLKMPWSGSKVIVGDGPVRYDLEKKYPDALFVGKKKGKELGDYYRSSNVFVFPSKTDTFGIVLIEALACGLPVAAYNVMGPKDIITEDSYGALEEKDLHKAALRAIENADPEKCAAYATENYSWETAGKQFLNAL